MQLFRWFKNDHLKAYQGKSHILLSTKRPEIISINKISLSASSHKNLLGVAIDSESKLRITLKNYVSMLAKT